MKKISLCLSYRGRARVSPLSRLVVSVVHWQTVGCEGQEEDLLQCNRTVWNGGECVNRQAAAVSCTPVEGMHTLTDT